MTLLNPALVGHRNDHDVPPLGQVVVAVVDDVAVRAQRRVLQRRGARGAVVLQHRVQRREIDRAGVVDAVARRRALQPLVRLEPERHRNVERILRRRRRRQLVVGLSSLAAARRLARHRGVAVEVRRVQEIDHVVVVVAVRQAHVLAPRRSARRIGAVVLERVERCSRIRWGGPWTCLSVQRVRGDLALARGRGRGDPRQRQHRQRRNGEGEHDATAQRSHPDRASDIHPTTSTFPCCLERSTPCGRTAKVRLVAANCRRPDSTPFLSETRQRAARTPARSKPLELPGRSALELPGRSTQDRPSPARPR